MIPRYLLGNWWSRFWAYDEAELKALMEEFRAREFPLAVCIIDMDWHTTQTGNRSVGWTGYTWNRELFPDPAGFIAWLHAQGLRTALNLHPADGVHPHEAAVPGMAAAVGIDPATGEPVEFDSVDPRFVEAYFKFCTTRRKKSASISGGWTGSRASRASCKGWIRSGGSTTCISTTWGATASSARSSSRAGAGLAITATPSASPATRW
jgi:hypothetical protein